MSPMRPDAPAFVPSWMADSYSYAAPQGDENLTAQELEELQACEEWCELMMACDELEHDHMVALAMKHAPAQKLTEIERRAHVPSHDTKVHSAQVHGGRRSGASKQARQGRVRSTGALFQPQRAH